MNDLTKTGFIVPGEQDEDFLVNNPKEAKVFTIPFSPLEQRVQQEQPHLLEGLQKLKQHIGEEEFGKYFSTLQSIKLNSAGNTIMMITSNSMQRTHIEARHIPAIEKAFAVEYVRIVAM